MAPTTTTRCLLTTSLLIMTLTTSLAHPISCANETEREAVSFNPTIQIFTSSGPESHVNDTPETRVLDVLERMETRQNDLTAALASLQSKQDECLASAEPHLNDTTETRVLDALERMETRQDELTAALASLQSKQDEFLASAETHLNDTTATRVLDALERIETRQLTGALASPTPRDCSDVLAAGSSESGVYLIQPNRAPEAFLVYCDMTTDGGGWTVFQRRQNGNIDFFLDWDAYKVGFGDIEDEFWIGNDVLHLLANGRAMQLRVDMSTFDNETAYAEYSSFSVSDETVYYRLEVGGYQGTAGDSMGYSNGRAFSTSDEDHDGSSSNNCATRYHGAWWYGTGCSNSNLNGRYYIDGDTAPENDGIWWNQWKGSAVSLKKTEMKVRPL